MPYNPNPPANPNFEYVAENVDDWRVADKGKWFIVIDTHRNRIYVVPVNVFEGRGALDPSTLDNTSQRAKTRFASGVPADRTGAPQGFYTFGGHNWLEGRADGTHHTAVATPLRISAARLSGFHSHKADAGRRFCPAKVRF